jgi:hypothetical protein
MMTRVSSAYCTIGKSIPKSGEKGAYNIPSLKALLIAACNRSAANLYFSGVFLLMVVL